MVIKRGEEIAACETSVRERKEALRNHPFIWADFSAIGLWSGKVYYPMCARCLRPVSGLFDGNPDDVKDHGQEVVLFRVWCHGETDTVMVTHRMVEESTEIAPGWAFSIGRIGFNASDYIVAMMSVARELGIDISTAYERAKKGELRGKIKLPLLSDPSK